MSTAAKRLQQRRLDRAAVALSAWVVGRSLGAASAARTAATWLARHVSDVGRAVVSASAASVAAGIPLTAGLLAFGATARAIAVEPRASVVPRPDLDPEAAAVAHEQTTLVAAALGRLPARQHYVIARRFGLGEEAIPLSEIARHLRVSPQRAKAIEQAALRELALALAPLLDSPDDRS